MSKIGVSPTTARRLAAVGVATVALVLPTAAQAFNPQPDPPGRASAALTALSPTGVALTSPVFFPPGPCLVA